MDNILKEAQEILAERGQVYGDASESFDRIAQYWNNWLRDKIEIKADDVAMMMVLFKIARQQGKHQRDNQIDAINYLTLYNEVGLAMQEEVKIKALFGRTIKTCQDSEKGENRHPEAFQNHGAIQDHAEVEQKCPWTTDRVPTIDDADGGGCVSIYDDRQINNWVNVRFDSINRNEPWMPTSLALKLVEQSALPKPSTLAD